MKNLLQIGLLAGFTLHAGAAAAEMEEYRVKALFLYNFTQFIEWPIEAFKGTNGPLNICVIGPSPFEKGELEEVIAGKRIDSHPLAYRVINDPSQSSACHIVFVSSAAAKRTRTMVAEHKQAGLLTVGENPGFAAGGGVVNFLVKDGRVRLEINVGAAEREKLRISAKLLKLAEIVK
jgi:hypothetical protein